MERYKKAHESKWHHQYTEAFKRQVCQDYVTGELTRNGVERRYSLGKGRLTAWLQELGYEVKTKKYLALPPMNPSESIEQSPPAPGPRELKRQLEDALLLAETYRSMLEQAEQELKIDIRKKSSTK